MAPRPHRAVPRLVYYSGHADGRALELGPSRLPLSELRAFITASGAALSVALVDACHSGALTRTKGVHRGPAYRIGYARGADVEGHIIITSSGAEELSQEGPAVRGSYFSHYLISGLRGAAGLSCSSSSRAIALRFGAMQQGIHSTDRG